MVEGVEGGGNCHVRSNGRSTYRNGSTVQYVVPLALYVRTLRLSSEANLKFEVLTKYVPGAGGV